MMNVHKIVNYTAVILFFLSGILAVYGMFSGANNWRINIFFAVFIGAMGFFFAGKQKSFNQFVAQYLQQSGNAAPKSFKGFVKYEIATSTFVLLFASVIFSGTFYRIIIEQLPLFD